MATSLNPPRVFLVVVKQYEEEAKELFKGHGVIVVSGHRFLGGFRTVRSLISMGRWMAG